MITYEKVYCTAIVLIVLILAVLDFAANVFGSLLAAFKDPVGGNQMILEVRELPLFPGLSGDCSEVLKIVSDWAHGTRVHLQASRDHGSGVCFRSNHPPLWSDGSYCSNDEGLSRVLIPAPAAFLIGSTLQSVL